VNLRAISLGALSAFLLATAAAAQSGPVVPTASGPVQGQAVGNTNVFKGIPFAAPPVGPLRWQPPEPVKPWTAPRNAADYGPICSQPKRPDGVVAAGGDRPQGEDCLYLNVWAPKGAKALPVMVWIHGGAHRFGSGEGAIYDGAAFARDGVVLVTINYRLGALGYFAHPALTKAAGAGAPLGGYGEMDQIAALAWVKKNIAAFGGDAKNVTVFGESAGGQSILALMATPSSKGLFDKAIVESGGGWAATPSLAEAEKKGVGLAAGLGLGGAEATADQLRAVPVEKLLVDGGGAGGVGPIADGRLLKQSPTAVFASGQAVDVPLIIGSNSYEASLRNTFPIPARVVLSRVKPEARALYTASGTEDEAANAVYTDVVMGAPARWVAAKESGGAPAFLYHFSYVATAQRGKVPGASHGSEIVYVFEAGSRAPGRVGSDEDRAMQSLMHSCWVGFAKTGHPVCQGGQAWPAYTSADDELMEFGPSSGVRKNFRKAFLDADQASEGR
jgi:para-nitrobenzyl esterase